MDKESGQRCMYIHTVCTYILYVHCAGFSSDALYKHARRGTNGTPLLPVLRLRSERCGVPGQSTVCRYVHVHHPSNHLPYVPTFPYSRIRGEELHEDSTLFVPSENSLIGYEHHRLEVLE